MSSEMRVLDRLTMPFGWRHNSWTRQLIVAVAFGWACATSQAGTGSANAGQTVTRVMSPGIDVRITTDRRVSRSIHNASMDDVWTALKAAYEQLEIPVTATDHAGWRLGNPRAQTRRIGDERMSRFFECGRAPTGRPRADQYDVTYSVFSRLEQTTDGQTVLLTEADGSARPRSVSTNPVHCSSMGTLERRIADLVTELLDRGNDPLG